MTTDIVAELGYMFLGSRLKRLAERLQADALKVHHARGVEAQPAELALLAAVDRLGPITISTAVEALGVSQPAVTRVAASLVDRDLLTAESDEGDRRQKILRLTAGGAALVAKAKADVWPSIGDAVAAMCTPLSGSLLEQLAGLERQLGERSLESRVLEAKPRDVLTVREYSDDLAQEFYAINAEWIQAMFSLEAKDRKILSDPRGTIVDPGGTILFVESAELGVIGTCALMKVDDGVFELTKMGVLDAARGRNAGKLLLEAALNRARAMKIDTLYLLTSSKCATAIRLYEKLGFEHDAEILKTYGAAYARCNVAMRYRG